MPGQRAYRQTARLSGVGGLASSMSWRAALDSGGRPIMVGDEPAAGYPERQIAASASRRRGHFDKARWIVVMPSESRWTRYRGSHRLLSPAGTGIAQSPSIRAPGSICSSLGVGQSFSERMSDGFVFRCPIARAPAGFSACFIGRNAVLSTVSSDLAGRTSSRAATASCARRTEGGCGSKSLPCT